MKLSSLVQEIGDDGHCLLPGVYSADAVAAMTASLTHALTVAPISDGAMREPGGEPVAARNVLARWPAAHTVWRRPPLVEALRAVLGEQCGLVRALYFDKPPDRTWALPWHKDLTIAVVDHNRPSPHFIHPTTKGGVPHVEAPRMVLEAMLTARIHLDEATEENGPLRVKPGSHHSGKALRLGERPPRSVLAQAGDVLLMRPLLAHCSNRSAPGTARHRRILHLEFAATPELPDGYAWYDFVPVTDRAGPDHSITPWEGPSHRPGWMDERDGVESGGPGC